MKFRYLVISTVIFAFSLITAAELDKNELLYQNPILGHYLTREEIDTPLTRDFFETDPPAAPVHNIAEFEAMQGVLIRYPFGIPYDLIAEMSQETVVTTIVSGQSQENSVLSIYNNNGVNTANCNFLYAPTDSYWTRDYGPWYAIDGNGEFGIVNFPYNRPRPNDNDIPIEMAEFLDINIFGMDLFHTGGNYMTDGMGISASSDLVLTENPSLSQDEINQLLEDYLGIHTYHAIPDPNNTYIDHIDCWSKFLAVDKVLIRSVPESHAQYDEIEATADYFAEQISSYGTPYEVYRVYTPNNQPYTNSLILNDRVFVPITNSNWDDEALEVYQEAMPGYEVLGFTGSWESTDALHCRAKGIADLGMLYIYHLPVQGEQPAGQDIEITAEIIAYSGETLHTDSLLVYYKLNEGEYTAVQMSHTIENLYTAQIPAASHEDVISYYIHAADASGRSANHPFVGAPDPHIYTAIQYPEMSVNIEDIEVSLQPEAVTDGSFYLANIGGGVLEYQIYTIDTRAGNRDLTGSYILCNATDYEAGTTVDWTFSVFNNSGDNEWVNEVIIDFPAGVYVNSATDFLGGSGGDLIYDEMTGDGAVINWFGETAMGFGVLHDGEIATGTVNVTLDPDLVTNLVIDYQINGDEFGEAPHSVNGQVVINGLGEPVDWITLDPASGEILAGDSDLINYQIDATSLLEGIYTCDIVMTGNAVADLSIPVTLTVSATSADNDGLPVAPITMSNYPNPFNPTTTINFQMSGIMEQQDLELEIYNIKGQKIKTYFPSFDSAQDDNNSSYSITWNGTDENGQPVPSGIYYYRLKTDAVSLTRKMLLLK